MGNLPVIYGNGNIPNLTGNFRTLLEGGRFFGQIRRGKLSIMILHF